jgi:hypothetical protein
LEADDYSEYRLFKDFGLLHIDGNIYLVTDGHEASLEEVEAKVAGIADKPGEFEVTSNSTEEPKVSEVGIEQNNRIADIITTQLDLKVDLVQILTTLEKQGLVEKNNNEVITDLSDGRDAIIFNINGTILPIYRSSKGTSSKTVGKWYPFFFMTEDWVVKGMSDNYKNGYNNPIIKQILDSLNDNYIYNTSKAKVKTNPRELLNHFTDVDFNFDNNGIYGYENYNIAVDILKLWQDNLGTIDITGYDVYVNNIKENLIKTNPKLEKEISTTFNAILNKFSEIDSKNQPNSYVGGLESVSDSDYNNFIDTGNVDDRIINRIATNIKNNKKLSKREFEIFNDKTSEINEKLKEFSLKPTGSIDIADQMQDVVTDDAEYDVDTVKKFIHYKNHFGTPSRKVKNVTNQLKKIGKGVIKPKKSVIPTYRYKQLRKEDNALQNLVFNEKGITLKNTDKQSVDEMNEYLKKEVELRNYFLLSRHTNFEVATDEAALVSMRDALYNGYRLEPFKGDHFRVNDDTKRVITESNFVTIGMDNFERVTGNIFAKIGKNESEFLEVDVEQPKLNVNPENLTSRSTVAEIKTSNNYTGEEGFIIDKENSCTGQLKIAFL